MSKNNHLILEYSAALLKEINSYSSGVKFSSDYINEIFLYFYIPFFEKKHTLDKKSDGVYFFFKNVFFLFISFLLVIMYSILISLYTLLRFRRTNRCYKLKMVLVRAPATYQKLKFLQEEGVVFFSDDLVFNEAEVRSIYSTLGFFKRILSLIYVPIYSIADFFKIYNDARNMVGFSLTGYAMLYFSKRIAQKCNLEFYLQNIFKKGLISTYYTGNKEDRFALLEKRLCKEFKVGCICIPHGLEYSYKMPGGLVGDQFYCTSLNAQKYLERIYQNKEINFCFDEKVAKKMFSRNFECSGFKKIVFFPESREPNINLKIMEYLIKNNVELYVKLHVKDSIKNYGSVVNDIKLIESFDDAISHNICLARKSTVLVEALYNNSTAIAILIDNRDKSFVDLMFPSLADPNILRVESFQQLKHMLTSLKE